MKLFQILSLYLIVAFSCNSHGEKKESASRNKEVFSDTVLKDIPKRLEKDTFYQRREAKQNEMLGLPNLQNGFDGIQIRIWMSIDLRDTQRAIVFTNHDSEWTATFYYYKVLINDDHSLISLKKRVEIRKPKSGWESFIDSLKATDIENLPDFEALHPNYNHPTDSYSIIVEIGTSKKYRFYQYPALDLNKELEGPSKLEKALFLIKREFDYTIPDKYELN